ncbi:MAG TPA: alpha/beta hydrolase [Gemmatimonadaceae bacterium]|nr:alpha/beta hydrolase [Gemmatimonadaceae bacterium]
MRGEFVEVGQYRLYYYAAGTRGQGDPIILIHGFPTSSHLWSNLVSLLPAGHRVVVPDLLGFGRSDIGERADLSIRGHADRLLGLMDVLGITRCFLVGHHMGACIATSIAAIAPQRASQLALLHPLAGDVTLTGTLAVLRAFMPLSRLTPMAWCRPALRAELSRWFSDALRGRASVEQYLSAWQKPPRWKQFLRQLVALSAHDVAECTRLLRTLTIPVNIVASDDDPAVPHVVLDRLREVIPNAPLDIIRDARHFSPEETPERIAGILARVLRSQQ